jgi:hypothetical protein
MGRTGDGSAEGGMLAEGLGIEYPKWALCPLCTPKDYTVTDCSPIGRKEGDYPKGAVAQYSQPFLQGGDLSIVVTTCQAVGTTLGGVT